MDLNCEIAAISEAQMPALGRAMAKALQHGGVLYLHGELGAGKTTLARAILTGLGISERIKSPTYTLVETYSCGDAGAEQAIYHMDLYRLADPEELLYLGVCDQIKTNTLVLVEWPDRGGDFLPKADVHVHIAYQGSDQRRITLSAGKGGRHQWLAEFSQWRSE